MKKISIFLFLAPVLLHAQNLRKWGSDSTTSNMYGICNVKYRLGVGTTMPLYQFHLLRAVTGQAADSRALNVETTGSIFNTSAAARVNYAAYITANATKLAGGFSFTNIGVMGVASGGDVNYGIGTSNSSYTGAGYFYQSANNTTRLQGGPSTENIQFGPDNAIRLNSNGVIIPANYLSVGANANNLVGAIQVYGKLTVSTHDIASNSDSALTWDRATNEYKIAKIGSHDLHVVSDADYTIGSNDYSIVYSSMTAARTLTLPSASTNVNRILYITNGGGGAFTINLSASVRTNSSTTFNTLGPSTWIMIQSDGTEWWKIAN